MKKILFLIIILGVLIPPITLAQGELNDIENHWAKEYIEPLVEKNIIGGYPDGSFKPDNSIKISEFAKLISVAIKGTDIGNGSTNWYDSYVTSNKDVGIIKDGEFEDYNRPITREEMTRMIVRALGEDGIEGNTRFADENKIGDEFKPYVKKAVELKIINGYPSDNTFRPQESATRAASSKVISVMLEQLENNKENEEYVIEALQMTDEEVWGRENIEELASMQYYDVKDGKLYFDDIYNYHNYEDYLPEEKAVPNLNQKVHDVTKVLIDDNHYTETLYSRDGISAATGLLIGYAINEKYAGNNNYYFRYGLKEDKKFENYEGITPYENANLRLSISRLCNQSGEEARKIGWIEEHYNNKLKESLIVIFGYETGNKMHEYIISEYLNTLNNGLWREYEEKIKIIGNIEITFIRDFGHKFYFNLD